MGNIRKRATGVAAAAVVAVSLAGCGGGSTNENNNEAGPAKAGGTLKFLQYSPSEHLDPQRMYIGRDLSNFGRTVYRSLVTFPPDPRSPLPPSPWTRRFPCCRMRAGPVRTPTAWE